MKVKNLLFVLLSVALFACGTDVDTQPDPDVVSLPSTLLGPSNDPPSGSTDPLPSDFNIIINFSPTGTDDKKAIVRFGISTILDEDLTIDPEFFSSTAPSNPFLPLLDPYALWTIPAGSTLSEIKIVNTPEFPMCAPAALINLAVGTVKFDGVVVPESNFNVVGMNPDGTTSLLMAGNGDCGGSGQVGDVSLKDFLNAAKDNMLGNPDYYGGGSGSNGDGTGWGYWGFYMAYGYQH